MATSTASVAGNAVSSFVTMLAGSTQCSTGAHTRQSCALGNLDVAACSNLKFQCCNQDMVQVLSCDSSAVRAAAVASVMNALNASSGVARYTLPRLDNYLVNKANKRNVPGMQVTERVTAYLDDACSAFVNTDQSTALPKLTEYQCSDDVVNAYNQADVSVQCAMGAISQLLPGSSWSSSAPQPAAAPWYQLSAQAQAMLLLCGALLLLAGAVVVVAKWLPSQSTLHR